MSNRLVLACIAMLAGNAMLCTAQTDSTNGQSLGDIARQLRQQKSRVQVAGPAATALPQPSSPQSATVPSATESLGDAARRLGNNRESQQAQATGDLEWMYKAGVRQSLAKEDFDALESAAAEARTTKGRLPGGVWKLLVFYEVVGEPGRGERATDAEWQDHIALLKRWMGQKPQSVAPRIALAEAYQRYAWKARGSGYSNTVKEDGWKTMQDRMELAAATLVEAYKLPEKDPYWYGSMQQLLRAVGIDKPKMRELFDRAIAFEPTYYHFYREYATFLLPKWEGEPGEAEAFAEETYKRVGGKEGAFVYFEIASVIYCDCSNQPEPLKLSWKRIQEGYAYMATTYGTSNLKRNRMASLALQAGDRTVAHDMFTQIGEAWDSDTWRSKARFEQVKSWAQEAIPPVGSR